MDAGEIKAGDFLIWGPLGMVVQVIEVVDLGRALVTNARTETFMVQICDLSQPPDVAKVLE